MYTHRLFKYKKGDTIRYLCHTLETTRKQSQKLSIQILQIQKGRYNQISPQVSETTRTQSHKLWTLTDFRYRKGDTTRYHRHTPEKTRKVTEIIDTDSSTTEREIQPDITSSVRNNTETVT